MGELAHCAAYAEHGREVRRDLDLQDRVGNGRAAVGQCDPLVQALIDESLAQELQGAGLELEGGRALVVLPPDRPWFEPIDEQTQSRQHAGVLRPQAVAEELAGANRTVAG